MADLTNEGIQAFGALSDQERKTAAYNVLAKTYGVALAGDPETALKAQQFQQNEITNPLAVQQTQANLAGTTLDNTGKIQTNDYNALARPTILQGLKDTNAQTEQTTNFAAQDQPGKLKQQTAQTNASNAAAGASNAAAAASKFTLGTAEGAQMRSSAMGLIAGLSDTASQGGDIGAAFDKIAPEIAKFENVDPAHLAPLRAKLVQDPVNTINQLSDSIQAINTAALKNTPAGQLAQQKYADQRAAQVQALGVTAQRTQAVPAATDAALSLLPAMSSSAILRKARAEIPGTPEYKFNQVVQQIKTNASLDDLRALRASGTSLGRVTNTEFTASANAFANLDLGQDPAMLKTNLSRLKTTYGVINDNLAADAKRLDKAPANGSVHVEKPAAASFKNGVVYTDAQGNKATTSDGGKTWTEAK